MDEFNTEADLKSFTIDTYERLDEMQDWLPVDFHRFFQSMKKITGFFIIDMNGDPPKFQRDSPKGRISGRIRQGF